MVCFAAGTEPNSVDSNMFMDLKLQLQCKLESITKKYSLYVSFIRGALEKRSVSPRDLCSDLLTMPATNLAEQQLTLLSAHQAELKKANTLNDIFDLLATEYASFLNYGVFQFILEKYQISRGEEVLKYPEHLKSYLMEHKVSEFVESNPPQRKHNATSKELVLKIDIELTTRMSNIIDLRASIAKILGINPTALQLLDIRKGSIVVTFLIPTPLADQLFNEKTFLTDLQENQIRALSVVWMQCNSCMFTFGLEDVRKQKMSKLLYIHTSDRVFSGAEIFPVSVKFTYFYPLKCSLILLLCKN
jgi:hypothetical protein